MSGTSGCSGDMQRCYRHQKTKQNEGKKKKVDRHIREGRQRERKSSINEQAQGRERELEQREDRAGRQTCHITA